MGDLTITFLGTGTSQGVPVPACDCPTCLSDDLRDNRMRSSIYVHTPECAFVVDTGPDFRSQALRAKLKHLDAVVYTHAHTDHVMGFDDLRPFFPGSRPLPVYASPATISDLERVFLFAFSGENRFPGYLHPVANAVTDTFSLGETQLTPLPVPHGKTTVFGYLFTRRGEKLAAYISDCKAVPDPVIERIRGVKHLIVDALRHKPHPTHMNIDEALAVAAQVQPGQTWFTHLCHEMKHADVEPTLPAGVRIAFDGLQLTP